MPLVSLPPFELTTQLSIVTPKAANDSSPARSRASRSKRRRGRREDDAAFVPFGSSKQGCPYLPMQKREKIPSRISSAATCSLTCPSAENARWSSPRRNRAAPATAAFARARSSASSAALTASNSCSAARCGRERRAVRRPTQSARSPRRSARASRGSRTLPTIAPGASHSERAERSEIGLVEKRIRSRSRVRSSSAAASGPSGCEPSITRSAMRAAASARSVRSIPKPRCGRHARECRRYRPAERARRR